MKNEHFPYDRVMRELLQLIPLRFCQRLLGQPIVKVLDPTFPRVSERQADFLGLALDGRIDHVEIQTTYDPHLPIRMVDYYIAIYFRYKQYPRQYILWIGEAPCPYSSPLTVGRLVLPCEVWDIRQLDCEHLLESDDIHDVLLAGLCRRDERFWKKLAHMLRMLPPGQRRDVEAKLSILAKLREDFIIELKAFKKREGDMHIVLDLENDPAFQIGKKKGFEEGIQEGILQDAREMVLEVLRERFGTVPEDVVSYVQDLQNHNDLKKLHRLAIQVTTLDEFILSLQK